MDYISAEDYYQAVVFYTTIDVLTSELKERFAGNDYGILRVLLKLESNSHSIYKLAEFYDFDCHQLECEVRVSTHTPKLIIFKTPQLFPKLAQLFVVMNLTVMFPLVWKLILIAACIPVSTASPPEWSFSSLRRLKTYLRITMEQQRLRLR
ncbi:Zinc finger MYM-type protein 1-like [Oopsacas minuta]|uniref:Zinc finger MYM-type protein 1-like n=1 Tax=Oopsacas minuta TaxID=111878 RepID=A0AAV7JF69_9METZ|nr:Zinc finger MYM-type protein 1-like [Oopsacas minuta]